jgi:MFS family permease
MGYTPIESGAATLPVTAMMLAFSARAGALAQRIGPRIPLTIGPLVIAVGFLLMAQIDPGDSYVTAVLPPILIFSAGLTLVVAPVTATVLAAADARHAGIASGINNAVARIGGLLAVALLPVIAGLTGDAFYDPASMTDGFRIAMLSCGGLAAAGGVIAWFTISSDVLHAEPEPGGARPTDVLHEVSCGAPGPLLRPGTEADCEPVVAQKRVRVPAS